MRRRSQRNEIWTVVKTFLDTCQVRSGPARGAEIQWVRTRTVRAAQSRQETAVTDVAHVVETNRERISRRQVDKFAERRTQLATAALQTLAELGYARTSLREIAQNSEFSHGVLHYYFSDKIELITCCVRQYKAECVKRYDNIVAASGSPEELRRGFGAVMAGTLRDEARMHRL